MSESPNLYTNPTATKTILKPHLHHHNGSPTIIDSGIPLDRESFEIISGTSNPALALEVGRLLGKEVDTDAAHRFKDGEPDVQLARFNLSQKDVCIFQSISPPEGGYYLWELFQLSNAAKYAKRRKTTAVLPYFGGSSRSDKKDRARVPIAARLQADLMEASGISFAVMVDIHALQIQGFFSEATDNMPANQSTLAAVYEYIGDKQKIVFVSPDYGASKRTKIDSSKYAQYYGGKSRIGEDAHIDKHRNPNKHDSVKIARTFGNVKGKIAIVTDDIIDTFGTALGGIEALYKKGAEHVIFVATHGVYSPPALERIYNSDVRMVFTTNSIAPSDEVIDHPKIQVVDISQQLAETLKCVRTGESVSELIAK